MSEALAALFEQQILAHRLLDLPSAWAKEIVFPYYEGLSICNLPHTVLRLLEGKRPQGWLGTAPLDGRLWEPLWGEVKRVVLFVSDGLGWRLLQELVAQDAATAQIVADLCGDGTLTPITSIAPSTTAAALPSLWTGAPPAVTGLVGTQVFLREYSVLADLLYYRPANGHFRPEELEDWGLDFETLMPVPTLGQELGQRQIPSYALLQKDLFGSGLSRVIHRGLKRAVRHSGYTDLWIALRDLLRETRRTRCYINVYWGAVDSVSHLYGTVTEQVMIEVRRQLGDLRDTLAADGVGDKHTLVMFAADHGHTPIEEYVNLAEHAPLAEALRCGLGGEGRFAYCYLRHDFRAAVQDYLGARLADRVAWLRPAEALAAGLFGPGTPHPESAARLGDLALIARAGVIVGDRPPRALPAASRHGGFSEREMLVPLLMRRL